MRAWTPCSTTCTELAKSSLYTDLIFNVYNNSKSSSTESVSCLPPYERWNGTSDFWIHVTLHKKAHLLPI